MTNIADLLFEYATEHSTPEPQILEDHRRETWQKALNPRMISGHLQGRLLAMLSKLTRPKNILEIGTYTGYATLCLAEGLTTDGSITTIDKNEELKTIQDKYFKKSIFFKQIKTICGDALTIIPKLEQTFDLVFIDGQKTEYQTYFDLILPKVSKGGIILSDNVLWNGKVVNPSRNTDTETQCIISYNNNIKQNKKLKTVLLPIRDGLSISMKIK